MTYTKSCPYCNIVYKSGHGDPIKRLGSPLIECPQCKQKFIDRDIIEWCAANKRLKLSYIFSFYPRFIIFISLMLGAYISSSIWDAIPNDTSLLILARFAILFVFSIAFGLLSAFFCYKYKMRIVEQAIDASKTRCLNQSYIMLLWKSNYPLSTELSERCRVQDLSPDRLNL